MGRGVGEIFVNRQKHLNTILNLNRIPAYCQLLIACNGNGANLDPQNQIQGSFSDSSMGVAITF